MNRALALFIVALAFAACRPSANTLPPDVPVTDAAPDAALVGDALQPGGCAALCAHLDAVGCHPLPTCVDACARGVTLLLLDPADIDRATHATTAGEIRALHDDAGVSLGFCR